MQRDREQHDDDRDPSHSPYEFSTTDEYGDYETPLDRELQYRTISKGAVIALLLALAAQVPVWMFALGDPLFWAMVWLPIIAAVLGVLSYINIRRYPNELSGKIPALLSLAVAVPTIVGGIALYTYVYYTEVPEGYERISWYDLKPDRGSRWPIPADVGKLHGKKVFIAGYVHPSVSSSGAVNECTLVGDMGTCCFGGMPALTDQIDVRLKNGLSIRYTQTTRKLGGTFVLNVNPDDPRSLYKPKDGSGGVYYTLLVDYLK
ncbi:MAG: hypothetical protein RIC55_12685 [Pirellulaceae bacterium]